MARPASGPPSGRPEMTLDFASVPLAAAAGALGIFSPCVWPLIPVVMSSAATAGRSGPWLLTAGLALSFAFAGTLLSFLLVSAGLDPELFRYFSGGLLGLIGGALLWPKLGDRMSGALSAIVARAGTASARPRARVRTLRPGASSASAACSGSSGCPASARPWAPRSVSRRWDGVCRSPSSRCSPMASERGPSCSLQG